MRDLVMPGISKVKSGEVLVAGTLLEQAIGSLLERGAKAVILGCTEVPVALDRLGLPRMRGVARDRDCLDARRDERRETLA